MSKVNKIAFKGGTNLLKMHENKFSPTNNNQTETSPKKNANNDNTKTLKNLTYVSSAVALASLGVTTAFAIKNGKFSKLISKLSHNLDNTTETISKITKNTDDLTERITTLSNNTRELGTNLERGLEEKKSANYRPRQMARRSN